MAKRLTGTKGALIAFGILILAGLALWLIFPLLGFVLRFIVPGLVVLAVIMFFVGRKRDRS
ncbi:MAG: hypothetical protein GF399_09020 [Candidatus Coatesbacteria bacterium]|nr:hypothetical protein [Candidatus Coatesbacteria bacterium]